MNINQHHEKQFLHTRCLLGRQGYLTGKLALYVTKRSSN